jgi:type VI secretion system lysozyme-like protein
MAVLRMLERLRYLQNPPKKQPEDLALEIASIMKHIQWLLSTHRGTVLISDDYGMPDVFYSFGVDYKKNSKLMRDSLVELIRKYETRFTLLSVEMLSEENTSKQFFSVKGRLKRIAENIEFTVQVTSEGKITLFYDSDRETVYV